MVEGEQQFAPQDVADRVPASVFGVAAGRQHREVGSEQQMSHGEHITARIAPLRAIASQLLQVPGDVLDSFLCQAPAFEQVLTNDGIDVVKFWFSVSRTEQLTRFAIRQVDPVRQWKLSPMDLASLDKWDSYTAAKESMFLATDTDWAPWTVVKSNDKKRARVEAMRHVLHMFDYEDKDTDLVKEPDGLIVGSASRIFEDGENTQAFSQLRGTAV